MTPRPFFDKCLKCLFYPLLYLACLELDRADKSRRRAARARRSDPYNHDKNYKETIIPSERKAPGLQNRRRLTLPPNDLVAQSQAFTTQSNSALLQRLPREIRDMIWKEVVGGRVIHLWYKGKFGHIICVNQNLNAEGGDVVEWKNRPEGCPCWHSKKSKKDRLLGLILTCRIIYSEALKYLYSENTFDLASPHLLCSLPRLLLPQYLNGITSLHFLWQEMRDFQEVWKVLTEMDGLKVLRMDLWFDLTWITEFDSDMKERISGVKGLQIFEVVLPKKVGADDSVLEDLSCTVFRRQ